jgi:MoaA/NifB/PqqE/SkfB family radical SAM enzyme
MSNYKQLFDLAYKGKQDDLKQRKPYVFDKIQRYDMRIVRLEYSYLCNFTCTHCLISEFQQRKDERTLTIEDVKQLAVDADKLGFSQFVISGGEPLAYLDFEAIVQAIDPDRFYITTDTNGWLMSEKMAYHLKDIGVDKVQFSIDNLYDGEHDLFRHKPGSHARALAGIRYCKEAGLNVIVQTVVEKKRAQSQELVDFIEYFNSLGVEVCILYAKPAGKWAGKSEVMVNQRDIDYVESLADEYAVFSHLTPTGGCIAMKRMINITSWGDVNPCPIMQEYAIGNIFREPLADIVKRGDKLFEKHIPICIMAQEQDWRGYIERMNNK